MTTTHINEPINSKNELSGNSRRGGDAPPEVQQKVIDIIIEEARNLKFNNRDIAHYIAIAKRESGFNPDAASKSSSASGIAQVIDDTGETYGVNDNNRFDARTSIKAGLGYFFAMKSHIVKDYGSAAGEYEPLIYYCYHYGEFSTRHKEKIDPHKTISRPTPLSELISNPRYSDSKTVVDEAARIEEIINDTHGLKVQLADVLGKPMTGRKVIVVQKVAKPTPAAVSNPTPEPAATVPESVISISEPAPPATIASEEEKHTSNNESAKDEAAPEASSNLLADSLEKWDLLAYEVTTDGEGHIPEIKSESQEPFLILIPRIDYEAYNEAVAKQEISEEGNKHDIPLNNGENGVLPTIKSPESEEKKPPAPKPIKSKEETPSPKPAPKSIFEAADHGAKQKPLPPQSPGQTFNFNDVVIALKKDLGWENVYETSFAYVKQFLTRPRLPDKPLDENTFTKKSPARVQVIGSSIKNKDTNTLKVKDKVTTTEETAVKSVEVVEDAPWMVFAIQEQSKAAKVTEVDGSQSNDDEWKQEKIIRDESEKNIKLTESKLQKEKHKPEKLRDVQKISEFEQQLKEQEQIRDEADLKMQEIEKKYNNQDVVKYLKSTSLQRNSARDDATPWCASFANWCVEQSGFHGTGSASADSWLNWGEKIDEPRYGAITVTTRANNPIKYHVGFYLHMGKKSVYDCEEEVETKGKNGDIVKRKKKKFKSVEAVHLLSGNFSNRITEASYWTTNAEDDSISHLVSYRWPTSKEKKQ